MTEEQEENLVWDVIKALKAKACEDCVSRKRVKYLIHTLHIPKEYEQPLWDGLNDLPLVTPKQRPGKWIQHGIGFRCSECAIQTSEQNVKAGLMKYCPNCGAKMEGEEKKCTDCKWYGFTCECPVHCTQDTKNAWESATKEGESECDWLDCKYNDGTKCHNNSTVLGESCYEPATKEGE